MTTYKVTITGQQQHIISNEYFNQSLNDVENIINKYWDEEYEKPQHDGNSWDLNNEQYICIEEE